MLPKWTHRSVWGILLWCPLVHVTQVNTQKCLGNTVVMATGTCYPSEHTEVFGEYCCDVHWYMLPKWTLRSVWGILLWCYWYMLPKWTHRSVWGILLWCPLVHVTQVNTQKCLGNTVVMSTGTCYPSEHTEVFGEYCCDVHWYMLPKWTHRSVWGILLWCPLVHVTQVNTHKCLSNTVVMSTGTCYPSEHTEVFGEYCCDVHWYMLPKWTHRSVWGILLWCPLVHVTQVNTHKCLSNTVVMSTGTCYPSEH